MNFASSLYVCREVMFDSFFKLFFLRSSKFAHDDSSNVKRCYWTTSKPETRYNPYFDELHVMKSINLISKIHVKFVKKKIKALIMYELC